MVLHGAISAHDVFDRLGLSFKGAVVGNYRECSRVAYQRSRCFSADPYAVNREPYAFAERSGRLLYWSEVQSTAIRLSLWAVHLPVGSRLVVRRRLQQRERRLLLQQQLLRRLLLAELRMELQCGQVSHFESVCCGRGMPGR